MVHNKTKSIYIGRISSLKTDFMHILNIFKFEFYGHICVMDSKLSSVRTGSIPLMHLIEGTANPKALTIFC